MKTIRWHFLIIVALLSAFLLLGCVPASAESSGVDGNISWVISDDGVLTISGTGPMNDYSYTSNVSTRITTAPWGIKATSVVIHDGVTRIGDYAFYGCNNLTSITIPDSVNSIGSNVFYDCSNLTSITMPAGVTSIGESVFCQCKSLTSITIPNSVTSIGDYAFASCSSLTNIALPDAVTSIGKNAFIHCTKLTSITIPKGVTSIGDATFCNCSGLISITLPDGITSIGQEAFYMCKSLTSITIPDGVTSIGFYAFSNCSALKYAKIGSEGAKALSKADYSFTICGANCELKYLFDNDTISDLSLVKVDKNATIITIPDGVTNIGNSAFRYHGSLTSVTIPDGVTSIGNSAFESCSSLRSITIPDGVTSIGIDAFDYTLKNIFFRGDASFDSSSFMFISKPTIYCYEYTTADTCATKLGYSIVYLDDYDPDSVRKVSFDKEKVNLAQNTSSVLPVSVFPDYDRPTIVWSTSDPSIATIKDGIIAGISKGTCTITATVGSASASREVTVFIPGTDFTFSESEYWITAKDSLQISVNSLPEGTYIDNLIWETTDTDIAEIDEDGKVTTYKPGDVTISAKMADGTSHEVTLHVCYPVTAIKFKEDSYSVKAGRTVQLQADVSTKNHSFTNQSVRFSSSDEKIASADASGVVTGYKAGEVTITATATSGVSASCEVTVQESATLTLPSDLTSIEAEAFSNITKTEVIVIPESVTSIAKDAFSNNPNVVLFVTADSYAESWAIENNMNYITR